MSNQYKFNFIKVFGSVENLYGNVKKYRKVFDEKESAYIYSDLSFFNKLFDEQDWQVNIRLLCKNTRTGAAICDMRKTIDVMKDMNIVNIREGWGTPDIGWWKTGSYKWEAYIQDEFVGEAVFYVVNYGKVMADNNPYLHIEQIRLFESPKFGLPIGQRRYLKAFNKDTTRYINAEIKFANKLKDEDFVPLEFQFNFYNDSGQHKAYMEYLLLLTNKEPNYVFDTGYGSERGGYWYEDQYMLEVIFMDQRIATVNFVVGKEDEEAGPLDFESSEAKAASAEQEVQLIKKPTFEEATAELDSLIGLEAVKKEIEEFSTYLKFLQIRKNKGFDDSQRFNLNTVFTGNPGTGKTTVARMLGRIYWSLDLLSKGHVTEVGRGDLVAEYIGQTAPKVKKAIEQARGGILFIDEAYSLTDRGDDGRDFGREVIEVLLKEMSDGQGDIGIIFAGYPKQMQHFLAANPGLTSRIQDVINFPDYTPNEMMQIADYTGNKRGVQFSPEARELMNRKIVEAYRNRDVNFGNARLVNAIVEEAKQNMAIRLMKKGVDLNQLDNDTLSTVILEDIERAFKQGGDKSTNLPVDEPQLQDCLAELRELTGLELIKKEVEEMVKLVRYYRDIGKDIKKSFSMHTVLTGNPGTGKTTVARLLVRIYKALGILERGHLVECDRKDLVAGYIGQTAIKTDELIQQAMGGGLFIDEAYSLTMNSKDWDFGREAIETLLKRMEDYRGQFMVIVAGYTNEMRRFLEANPGLMSRFDKQLHFEDYTPEELMQIVVEMLQKENLVLTEEAFDYMAAHFVTLLEKKHKYFGNARTARKIVQELIRKQNLRLADIQPAQRTQEMIQSVIADDVRDFSLLEQKHEGGKTIGFN